MDILAIESSCDETAAAVVRNGRTVLSSVVSSQIETHSPYFGVVPELASRSHVMQINSVIAEALKQSGHLACLSPVSGLQRSRNKLTAIAVTVGPGLVGSLLVGKMAAQTLGWLTHIPIVGVNHIEGHLLSPLLLEKKIKPPFLGLVVSGGHTELIYTSSLDKPELLGGTRDDAAGEAFDKVAKMMKLGYPGGPLIDRMAKKGRHGAMVFPRPWLPETWDFSFSGLKTAVLYKLRSKSRWTTQMKQDLCRGFQEAVVDVLVGKTIVAARHTKVKTIVVGGGVAANSHLRKKMMAAAGKNGLACVMAPPELCTDNAAMIGCAAAMKIKSDKKHIDKSIRINPHLKIPKIIRPLPVFRLSCLS